MYRCISFTISSAREIESMLLLKQIPVTEALQSKKFQWHYED